MRDLIVMFKYYLAPLPKTFESDFHIKFVHQSLMHIKVKFIFVK